MTGGRADDPTAELPFRQVAQHLPTPCWISDAEGVIVWVNDAWVAYTGKTVEALAAEGLAVLHDPQILPQVQARWAQTKVRGEPDEMAFPLRGRDGTLRPFLTRVVPLRDAEGEITRWFGTNTDISVQSEAEAQLRQSQATLRESEDRLRLATEAAGVGVWEWRLTTNEMIYSPRAKEICGFDPGAPVTYEMVAAATHRDDFPHTSAQATRALDPKIRDRSPYEYRIVLPSGEVRWVLAHGEAVFEETPDGGQVATRYVGTLMDITERKRAEGEISESERQLRLALKAGGMAVWRIDAKGALYTSPEMNELIGLPPDAAPRFEDLVDNYPPGELDRIRAAAQAARDRGEHRFDIEYRYRRGDGEMRWFYTRAEARVAADGAADGVIGLVMDITERKADEERLKFLAREVDHRANNLMSVVQGTVALSKAGTVDELRRVITGRVHALALAHQLLSDARWAGADLRRLIEEELAPFSLGDRGERVTVRGETVALGAHAAQSIAMVAHELTTNAAKHGSLSGPEGRVEVSWEVRPPDRLFIRWVETGGPPVTPPTRRGFGASVIARALGGALRGDTRLDWRPDGLVCELELSLGPETTAGQP